MSADACPRCGKGFVLRSGTEIRFDRESEEICFICAWLEYYPNMRLEEMRKVEPSPEVREVG